jgi:hypothetical protein
MQFLHTKGVSNLILKNGPKYRFPLPLFSLSMCIYISCLLSSLYSISSPLVMHLLLGLGIHRNQLQDLIDHTNLEGHLFILSLMNSLSYERFHDRPETALCVICDCDVMTELRCWHLYSHFMEASDYHRSPLSKVLHFLQDANCWRAKSSKGNNSSGLKIVMCNDGLILIRLVWLSGLESAVVEGLFNHQRFNLF